MIIIYDTPQAYQDLTLMEEYEVIKEDNFIKDHVTIKTNFGNRIVNIKKFTIKKEKDKSNDK